VRNANQQIIGVYAGDLLGNLWKFNLNNTAPSSWNVDLANTPLFTAGSGKPITAAPSVIPLTLSSKPAGGYMVVMGTGKFFEVDDIVTTNQQSLYGIWDPVPFGTAVATTALTDTSRLIQQTIGAAQNGVDGNTYFNISANAVDYTSATPNRGWFIDVPNSGQRMIYPFELLKGQFILADTISPANVSLDVCAQNSSGTGYLYLLDALTGAGPTIQVFDTNGDGNVDGNDLIVSGVQGSADGKNKTIAGDQTTSESKFFNCSADSPTCRRVTLNCSLTNSCPVSNPGAATIDSRMWQQLFMR
jgi:type IV pilus assembly protein PilY1